MVVSDTFYISMFVRGHNVGKISKHPFHEQFECCSVPPLQLLLTHTILTVRIVLHLIMSSTSTSIISSPDLAYLSDFRGGISGILGTVETVSAMLSAIYLLIAKCACPLLYKDQFEAVLNLFFHTKTCINTT